MRDVYEYSHIPANRQGLKARVGLKFRSMCGLDLKLAADAPGPAEDAPTCPACAAKAGW